MRTVVATGRHDETLLIINNDKFVNWCLLLYGMTFEAHGNDYQKNRLYCRAANRGGEFRKWTPIMAFWSLTGQIIMLIHEMLRNSVFIIGP